MKRKYLVFSLLFILSASVLMNAQKANPPSDFVYDLNDDGTWVEITEYVGNAKDVVVPDSIEDFPVGGCFLENNTHIVSVVLPDSCLSFSFYKCKYLEKVVLPKTLKTIPSYKRDYNKVVGCFEGCEALKKITLPEGLEDIQSRAFEDSGLESIVIPNSVKSIGNMAFFDCPLTSITIGKGIESIRSGAFGYCSSLTTFNIGVEQVEYGDNCFEGCSSLGLKEKSKIKKTGYRGEF